MSIEEMIRKIGDLMEQNRKARSGWISGNSSVDLNRVFLAMGKDLNEIRVGLRYIQERERLKDRTDEDKDAQAPLRPVSSPPASTTPKRKPGRPKGSKTKPKVTTPPEGTL
jgi:hypothetical protein